MNDDLAYEECTLTKVQGAAATGFTVERADGWSFFVPAHPPVIPHVGSVARFYGRGIGFSVRGLVIDGVTVFYRTEAEEEEFRANQMYGATVDDLLAKWDKGESIFSVELGGLGPGYEQCIQVMAVEFARAGKGMPRTEDNEADYRGPFDAICRAAPVLNEVGPSGAQYGAAKWLAWRWCFGGGPRAVIEAHRNAGKDDRIIQVSKHFPRAPDAPTAERAK